MLKDKVEQLLAAFFENRKELFLVDLKVSAGNDITVIIDGDQSVSLQDCLDASRAVENNLDREEEDFSLQVMSPGLSEPLKLARQYGKNVGRDLEIMLKDDTMVIGELADVNETGVVLVMRYRKPKEVGKGKVDVTEERIISFDDIKRTLVQVKF